MKEKITLHKENIYLFFAISALFLYRIWPIAYPENYQQDDVAELKVSFFEELSCAVSFGGDHHPLLSILIWFLSRFTASPEYIVSTLIIIFAILSLFFIFKIIKDEYSFQTGLIVLTILIFSQPILTYSVSIKQYIFELFCTVYSLRVVQKISMNEIKKGDIATYSIAAGVLFLFSFVNIFPILITTIFIIFKSKTINYRYLFLSFILITPFAPFFLDKLQRVIFGGYWDTFFISNLNNGGLYDTFYFLNSMFLKSLFTENLVQFLFVPIVIIFLFSFTSSTNLIRYSLIGFSSIYILSILKIYPIGAGRTDLLFLPYLCILIAGFIHVLLSKFSENTTHIFVVFAICLYAFNGIANSSPYYKDERIEPILGEIKYELNNNKTEIVVLYEQFYSLIYYSRELVGQELVEDINGCTQRIPKISNVTMFSKDPLLRNIEYKSINSTNFVLSESEKIIVVGIELPGTVGRYKEVEKLVKERGYELTSTTTYPNYLSLIYFDLND